jgi:uncharacterized protein (TIGR00369 family)
MDETDDSLTLMARAITRLPQFKALGLELVKIEPDHCVMALEQRDELLGDPERGVLHGGVVTTLLDSVCGTAVFAGGQPNSTVATLDLRLDYLRPARPDQRLIGEATVYRRTRNVAFVTGEAYQDDDTKPVARCTASFMLGSVGFNPVSDKST